MVLATNPATLAATANVKPGFEPMDDDTMDTSTPAANTAPAKPVEATPIAQAPAAPAANDAPSAVVVAPQPSRFAEEVSAMRGAADFTYGNFKIYKAVNGKIRCGADKSVLGTWVKVAMLGWDEHTQINPAVDGPKAKDMVAYSKDGVVIDSVIGEDNADWEGKTVEAYLAFMRTGDWRLAKKSVYIDIACAVLEAEANADAVGEIFQITLSPSSITSFRSYQQKLEQTAKAVGRSIPGFKIPADPFTFYFVCEDANKGDNSWTKLGVSLKAPVKA